MVALGQEELIDAVQASKRARGLDLYLFANVDMDNLELYHICSGPAECTVIQKVFGLIVVCKPVHVPIYAVRG